MFDFAAMAENWVEFITPPYPMCWACPTQCYGDANCDGYVDNNDLDRFYFVFNSNYPDQLYDPCVDFNRDGVINTTDLSIIKAYLYTHPPANCVHSGF